MKTEINDDSRKEDFRKGLDKCFDFINLFVVRRHFYTFIILSNFPLTFSLLVIVIPKSYLLLKSFIISRVLLLCNWYVFRFKLVYVWSFCPFTLSKSTHRPLYIFLRSCCHCYVIFTISLYFDLTDCFLQYEINSLPVTVLF